MIVIYFCNNRQKFAQNCGLITYLQDCLLSKTDLMILDNFLHNKIETDLKLKNTRKESTGPKLRLIQYKLYNLPNAAVIRNCVRYDLV